MQDLLLTFGNLIFRNELASISYFTKKFVLYYKKNINSFILKKLIFP